MAHISGFQKFKLMLENNNVNYLRSTAINEAAKLKDLSPIQAGSTIPSLGITKGSALGNAYTIALAYIKANGEDGEIREMLQSWRKILEDDDDLLPANFVGADVRGWKASNWAALSYAVEAGNRVKSGFSVGKKFMEDDVIKNSNMEEDSDYDIDLVPNTESNLSSDIYTMGTVVKTAGQKITKRGTEQHSLMSATKQYINAFNFYNYAAGGSTYEGDAGLTSNGFFDFESENINGTSLTIYVDKVSGRSEVGKDIETETKVIGYEPATKGKADIAFENGSDKISDDPQGQTKIDALAKTIATKFKDKTFDTFDLISSASPVWSGKETMANYQGKTIEGTGKPADVTPQSDFAAKNADLAYRRGIAIMKALNVSLKKLGHAGIPNYTVKWQISDKGGPANTGRFVDLLIAANEDKGKTVTTKKVVGKVKKEGEVKTGEFVLYAYSMS